MYVPRYSPQPVPIRLDRLGINITISQVSTCHIATKASKVYYGLLITEFSPLIFIPADSSLVPGCSKFSIASHPNQKARNLL